jgi:hypothetical protein
MVQDPVDHGTRDGKVPEDLAPAGEGQVVRQNLEPVFIADGDQLEEQVRGVLVKSDVARRSPGGRSGVVWSASGRVSRGEGPPAEGPLSRSPSRTGPGARPWAP